MLRLRARAAAGNLRQLALSLPPHRDVAVGVGEREAAATAADRSGQRVLTVERDGDRDVSGDRAEAGAETDRNGSMAGRSPRASSRGQFLAASPQLCRKGNRV